MAMRLQAEGSVQAMKERYARGNVQLGDEEAMDEIAAQLTERLLTDRGSIESLIRENPTLAQRFFDALREFIRKLTGRVDPQLRQAEKLWTEAYQAAKSSKNAAPEGGKAQFSIGKTTRNKPFVEVEQDILAGVPEAEWVKTVKENLKEKFPSGITRSEERR